MNFDKLVAVLPACLEKARHPRSFLAFVFATVILVLFAVGVAGLGAPDALPWLIFLVCLIFVFACIILWLDRSSHRA